MKSKLLLSASIVSLTIGLSGGAYASPSAAYYIDNDVSGDFTVPYDIGTPTPSERDIGLLIDDGATVSGDIVNDHQIKAYNTGVNVNESGALEGAFVNKDGGSVIADTIFGGSAVGVYEGGYGVSEQDVQNSGHILASALGVWHGTGTGTATGTNTNELYSKGVQALGVYQINGDGSSLSNDVSNDGHIVAKAVAEVNGTDVEANASAAGVVQVNVYGSALLNTLSNGADGHITASAIAKATGYGIDARAIAAASATGVTQLAGHAYEASNVLTNDGVINAYANATAQEHLDAAIEATAGAVAIGVHQEAYATGTVDHYSGYERDSLVNHGAIHASAFGSATGDLANVGNGTPLAGTTVSFGTGIDQYKRYEVPNDAAIGVFQVATDAYYQANETVDNFGTIEARGIAVGSGLAVDLHVAAVGVLQMATDVDVGTALLHNEAGGEIYATASAGGYYSQSHDWVHGDGAATTGHAQASAAGVFQFVGPAYDAYATVVNDGYIGAYARADMTVYQNGHTSDSNTYFNDAVAVAHATGIGQLAGGTDLAQAKVTNNGTVYAEASAGAFGPANDAGQYIERTALAVAKGVSQFVLAGSDASASVVNNGAIEAFAYAKAEFTDGYYGEGFNLAQATAEGVAQEAAIPSDGDAAKLSVVNGTSAEIVAGAYAYAEYAYTYDAIDGGARASALAIGVDQQFAGTGESGTAAVTNEGFIGAYAQGEIGGYVDYQAGTANAVAFGIRQGNTSEAATSDLYLSLNNSGQIYAAAEAYASDAYAAAVGVMAGDTNIIGVSVLHSYTDVTLHLDQLNTGRITAQAMAGGIGGGSAAALAVGIADRAGVLTGSIENDGLIAASAYAVGDLEDVTVRAIGIDAAANSDNLTITNKGTIVAYVNATGDVTDAAATGILLENYNGGDSGSAKIVNDGGTIFAGIGDGAEAYPGEYAVDQNNFDTYTNEGGFYDYFLRDHVVRGNAIRVSSLASGQDVEIDLKGTNNTGNIYGNILLGTNDDSPTIVVSNGLTRFNGIIESTGSFVPGVENTHAYDGSGTLKIEDGGTFKLVLNQDPETPYEYRFTGLTNAEQARVYVSTLDVQAGGILSIGLSPESTGGAITEAHYGQVFAENIVTTDGEIAGALKAHFIPGYYSANFHATYDSVVNSPDVEGGDGAHFADVYSNTPLIHVTATYVGDHVNIVADRVSFEDAAGTGNQKSVGHAIDQFYTGLSAPHFETTANYGVGDTPENYTLGDIIGSIFALDGTQAYENVMDDLSAEPYAQQLNQALNSFDGLQNLLLDRIGNGGGGGALGYGEEKMAANSPASNAIATTASIPAQPKAEFWARGFGDWQSQSDSSSAALAYTGSQAGGYFGGDTYVAPNLIVGAAGGLTSSSMSFDNGDHISSTGFQIAGYGRWDDNAWYVRGFGGYGQLSNDSKRYVPVMGTPVEMDGSYNTKVAGGYAELGYKGLSGRMGGITPFAGVSATWASNDAFTESGGAANLNVDASNATRVSTSLGAQLSWNTVVGSAPFEVLLRAAWQHAWTGGASSVNAAFNAEPTDGFTSTSTSAADLAALTASGTWKVAPLSSLTVQYDGKFGSGFVDTSVSGSFKQQF